MIIRVPKKPSTFAQLVYVFKRVLQFQQRAVLNNVMRKHYRGSKFVKMLFKPRFVNFNETT